MADTVKEAPPRCPDCGGELSIERDVVVDEPYLTGYMLRDAPPPRRKRVAYAAAFCGGCEFVVQIERPS
jgi:transposase